MDTKKSTENIILRIFDNALVLVKTQGYEEDITRLKQRLRHKIYNHITSQIFFREYVLVVFTSGFKARYVKKHWESIRAMTCDFDPEKLKERTFEELLEESPIKNKSKLKGLLKASKIITEKWWNGIQSLESWESVMLKLRKLPYIGEVTVYHIMRNIGFDFFKPDRHIENLAEIVGISDKKMFETIQSNREEDFVGVIDYILWQACELFGTAESFYKWAINSRDSINIPLKVKNKVREKGELLF